MTRKKTMLLIALLVISLVIPSFKCLAKDNISNDKKVLKANLEKRYYNQLKKLGYPDETIKFLSPEEIPDIVENNYKFISSSQSHTLFMHSKDFNNGEEISVPLSDQEFREYKLNKRKIVNEKLKVLSKTRPELKEYISEDIKSGLKNEIVMSASVPSVSKSMDTAVITLSVDCYDSSYDGYIYKTFGTNWRWSETPGWTLTDAVAVSYSGYWWTNIKGQGGYYSNYDKFVNLYPDATTNGTCIEYDIQTPSYWYAEQTGRLWIRAGNYDHATPQSLFTVWGTYGHTSIACTGISIGIDQKGTASIGVSFGTTLTQVSPKPYLADLSTY